MGKFSDLDIERQEAETAGVEVDALRDLVRSQDKEIRRLEALVIFLQTGNLLSPDSDDLVYGVPI